MTQGFTQNLPIPLPVNKGGTGAVTAASVLTNLGLTATATNLNLLTSASQTVVQQVYLQTGTFASGSTLIPFDNTIPQLSEGNTYMTLSITPKSASNILRINVIAEYGNSAVNNMIIALFQGATANAIAAQCQILAFAGGTGTLVLTHTMAAGSTSSTLFSINIGGSLAGTTSFNGSGGAAILGGVLASSIIITEFTP